MTRPGLGVLCRLSVVLALVLAVFAAPAAAQGQSSAFRIAHTVDKSAPAQVAVSGRVFNDGRADAVDVYVTAEALDSAGKVIASGVSYVGGVPAGSSTTFSLKVPAARAAASFRVIVSSFRFGFAVQS
ncbi:MAG TPA: FxLYD domain-containing protein [Terriglobales bacterium]|nr:FxLYD domain-containing protein [Terriglobales bacterium]